MKSLAVLKRALFAMAGVMAISSVATPAHAAPFYFYSITAVPKWGQFGDPQAVKGWSALTALTGGGSPFRAENYVSIALQGYNGYWYAYDTFYGEARGFVGADVSIPTAQWLAPAAYVWTGGPAGGGGVAFFNSFNPFTGIFYANELIVLDPFSCSASCELSTLEAALGSTSGTLTPSSGPPVIPTEDEDASMTPNPSGTNYFASGTLSTAATPEPPSVTYLLLALAAGGVVYLRRGRQILPTA